MRCRLERGRRADCRAPPARGGPRGRRDGRRRRMRCRHRRSLRNGLPRPATVRSGPADRADQRLRASHPLRRPAVGRRRVDRRGRRRRRERHPHRHVPLEQGRASRRAGSVPRRGDRGRRHRARARTGRRRVERPRPCFGASHDGPRATPSSPRARCSWSVEHQARRGRPFSRPWPHFAPTPAT